jgi:hypothetical protein
VWGVVHGAFADDLHVHAVKGHVSDAAEQLRVQRYVQCVCVCAVVLRQHVHSVCGPLMPTAVCFAGCRLRAAPLQTPSVLAHPLVSQHQEEPHSVQASGCSVVVSPRKEIHVAPTASAVVAAEQ